jgi:Flp pilus assembly protein TadD
MTTASHPATPPPRRWVRVAWWVAPLLAVAAAYHGALQAPFLFDDRPAIERNESIRQLWPLTLPLSPPVTAAGAAGRPLTNLTLAADYAWHGTAPRGYHATNLFLHALAGVMLWQLLRRTFTHTTLAAHREAAAAGATLLWLLHPLQTETVVCIVQRNEILVALGLLGVLLALERAASPRPRGATALAAAAALAGVASKEVMAVAPVVALMYDRTFLAGSCANAWRQRRRFYLILAATWLPLAWLVAGHGQRAGTAGFGLGTGVWDYLVTQCLALATYAQLTLWPHPLVLDYGPELARSLAAVAPQATLVLGLIGLAVFTFWIRTAAGFAAAAAFAVLAPSSSVVPLTTQPIAEHRMYLPLAALTALAAAALLRFRPRLAAVLLVIAGVTLGGVTVARVADYATEERIWRDTLAKAPGNARAEASLGGVLARAGRLPEALDHFAAAVRLRPDYADARNDFGAALTEAGRDEAAVVEFAAAARLKPEDPAIRLNLARTLLRLEKPADARVHLDWLLTHQPRSPETLAARGQALLLEKDFGAAIKTLTTAQELRPADAVTTFHLALAWQGKAGDGAALPHLIHAATLAPDQLEIRLACAAALQRTGQHEAAVDHYAAATRLRPDSAELNYNLGSLLLELHRDEPAAAAFTAAVTLRPDWIPARHNLALTLLRLQRPADAVVQHAEIARLEPSAQTLHNLALALAAAGRNADAIAADERALQLEPGFIPARRHRQQLLNATPAR